MAKQCTHLDQIQEVTPSANGCEDCLKIGDTWVHLRLCLICGHVGCCDSSKNKHATKHFHATNHPIIQSFQPGEDWEEALRKAVEDRCGLFISIISNHTAERLQGYNIFERKLAAKRRERLADNAIFYLPVRIDQGEPLIPENEPRGTGKIQAVLKEGGYLDEEFIGYLREKQRENCAALGYPLPPI